MIRIIFSLIMIIGGILFISLEIYNVCKKTIKMDSNGKRILKKQIETERLLKLITGTCFIVLGMILILNIVTGDLISILCMLILLLDKIFELLIGKKYKKQINT